MFQMLVCLAMSQVFSLLTWRTQKFAFLLSSDRSHRAILFLHAVFSLIAAGFDGLPGPVLPVARSLPQGYSLASSGLVLGLPCQSVGSTGPPAGKPTGGERCVLWAETIKVRYPRTGVLCRTDVFNFELYSIFPNASYGYLRKRDGLKEV